MVPTGTPTNSPCKTSWGSACRKSSGCSKRLAHSETLPGASDALEQANAVGIGSPLLRGEPRGVQQLVQAQPPRNQGPDGKGMDRGCEPGSGARRPTGESDDASGDGTVQGGRVR